MEAWEEEEEEDTSKTGEIGSPLWTKPAEGVQRQRKRDPPCDRERRMPPPVWLHSAFHSFSFIRLLHSQRRPEILPHSASWFFSFPLCAWAVCVFWFYLAASTEVTESVWVSVSAESVCEGFALNPRPSERSKMRLFEDLTTA